jgi:hypothetical protein
MYNKIMLPICFIVMIFALMSCDKAVNEDGMGTLVVKLTDAPFPLDKVKEAEVIIDSIEIRKKDVEPDGNPFILLSDEQQKYNLLELQNGLTVDLVRIGIPAGDYDLIRLYVQNATIVLNDEGETAFNLKVPSGEQTGIKVFIDPFIRVVGGLTSELLLDFDIRRSFVVQGNPETPAGIKGFHFKPVVRAVNVSIVGSIGGTVKDNSGTELASVLITLEQEGVELTPTAQTGSDPENPGKYLIPGLQPGLYKVIASKEGYVTKDSTDVEVFIGNQSQVDFILEEAMP